MAQTVCLHCGAAAPPRPDACPCTAAWTGAPEDAEPFAWLRVRPYADAPAPTRHVRVERERGRPVDPAGAGGHPPGPPDRVWGIVQPPLPDPSPREPAGAAGLFDGNASAATGAEAPPYPWGAPTAPHGASGGPGATADLPAEALPDDTAEVLPDDTVQLRRVPAPAPVPDDPAAPERARGRHRARGRAAGRHARTARPSGGPARTVGIAAAAAAVVGTATLTGALVDEGASVDRVAPVTTRLPAPAASTPAASTPAPPASAPPTTPGPSPSPPADDGPASASRAPSASPMRTARPRTAPPPEAAAPGIAAERRRPTSAPPPAPPRPSYSPATGRPSAPAAGDLCCGARGMEVVDLQIRLQRLGLYKGEVDGAYTRRLTRAVASYQRSRGVRADPRGVYGPATQAALRAEVPGILAY
ncbi:peptidoglycan-binding protein [Streptomyces sp. NPDC048001]|uniref:peptidoglycan-binding domain-containing protein n=1 Tax=Streptomyces sp. NPDC048001 TaxID=3365498 RepID=UPI00370FC4E3